MPTYEYKCNDCNRTFEYFQSMSEEPLTRCEECGGSVKRLIGGGAGIIFKGSGFYVTDYKGGSASKNSKTEKKAEAAPACQKDGGCCCNS